MIGDQERLFQNQVVVGGRVVVLKSDGFSVAEYKSKREVDFENRGLVSENAARLFAEGSWTDRRQAKIIPLLRSVGTTKLGANL